MNEHEKASLKALCQQLCSRHETLGDFECERLVALGAFGAVLQARQSGVREVALKLIPLQGERRERRELRISLELHHPNIVTSYACDEIELEGQRLLYLAMEWGQETLANRIQREEMGIETIGELARMLAEALLYLAEREKPIVHCDLKPSNILMVNGVWKLADFGMAKEFRGLRSDVSTQLGGTLRYMPPEVARSGYIPQSSWDMWSYGVLLAGVLLRRQLSGEDLLADSSLVHNLVSPFDKIVAGCLERDYDTRRYRASDVLEILQGQNRRGLGVMGRMLRSAKLWFKSAPAVSVPPVVSSTVVEEEPKTVFESGSGGDSLRSSSAVSEVLPTTGILAISSEPAGANVHIANAIVGKTPYDAVIELGLATERVVDFGLELSGYVAARRRVVAKLGERVVVESVSLEKAKATVVAEPAPVSPSAPIPPPVQPKQKSFRHEKTGIEFVAIPAGSFMMGGDKSNDEQPIHRVELDGFYMSKNVVTVGQYEAYCKTTRTKMPSALSFNGWSNDHAIVHVSWEDAKGYCDWAGVDLPTEAEWEYAARGGFERKEYPWGDTWYGSKCANSVGSNNLKGTATVGSYEANGYGLYDMAGNVWEWCLDWYDSEYYAKSPTKNPQNSATKTVRVLRGGSWLNYDPDDFRCAVRNYNGSPNHLNYLGIRVVFRGLP